MPDSSKTYAIHPALGIARMGNAAADPDDPTTFYLGAEAPQQTPNQGQAYKLGGKLKKQAQRFRIYEFDSGRATREITLDLADVATITWTVHLANRKQALHTGAAPGTVSKPAVLPPKPQGLEASPSNGANPHYFPANTRNAAVTDRAALCADAGPQTVGGAVPQQELNATVTLFPKPDQPQSKTISLGRLCVEAGTGRLLVFAADGIAEGWDGTGFSPLPKLTDWGNNDCWYDDTADGPVTATITFRDGSSVTIDQPQQRAWVIAAAPRYAPGLDWITTLYDVAVSECHSGEVPRPSFARDIYPLLRCASLLPWVSARASRGHSTGSGYYLAADRMNALSSTAEQYAPARRYVFERMRVPGAIVTDRSTVQQQMPQISSDVTTYPEEDYDIATVTPLQYEQFRRWSAGDFDADGVPAYVPFAQLAIADQPAALDHAALEGSCGTPFYPGIESWRIMRTKEIYADGIPLRIAACAQPGDLTIGNALPWQADFLDCNDVWWPVQRPNEVTRNGEILQEWVPSSWILNVDDPKNDYADYNSMVAGWWQLGFVVEQDDGASYVESEGSVGESAT